MIRFADSMQAPMIMSTNRSCSPNLKARLRSITRRPATPASDVLHVGDVVLDVATRRVTRAGADIDLTARETAFLEYLMRNSGLSLTRTMIENAAVIGGAAITRRLHLPAEREDELGAFAATFDRMLYRLQHAFARETTVDRSLVAGTVAQRLAVLCAHRDRSDG